MLQRTSPSSTASVPPPLLAELLRLLAAHRTAFRQDRTHQRSVALVFASLFAFARHTVSQLLLALGCTDGDWSAFYRLFSRARVDYALLSRQFLHETLAQIPADDPTTPYAVAVDAVQLPRCSTKLPGTSWLKAPRTPAFKPGIHRAQRFLHLAALLPRTAAGYSRALPLRFVPAFPPKAVPSRTAPAKEWEAGRAQLAWVRGTLAAEGRAAQRLLALADGAYAGADLWATLPAHTTLLARCAKNRALWTLPPTPTGRRGAPRKYGERARTPAAWLEAQEGWQEATIAVRGRQIPLRYRAEGPFLVRRAPQQPLFLLVVRGVAGERRWRRRNPNYFLVSAAQDGDAWVLPLPAAELLAWAWQRWEIEVAHRELKAGFGLGEIQSWHPTATELAAQWQVWAYAVAVLAGVRTWGLAGSPLRPPGRWWGGAARWSFGTLWRG